MGRSLMGVALYVVALVMGVLAPFVVEWWTLAWALYLATIVAFSGAGVALGWRVFLRSSVN